MIIKPCILALTKTKKEKDFFQFLASHYSDLFSLHISSDLEQIKDYQALFSFETLDTHTPQFQFSVADLTLADDNTANLTDFLSMNQRILSFIGQLGETPLQLLPYRFQLYDSQGKTLYSNQQARDLFDMTGQEETEETLEKWLKETLDTQQTYYYFPPQVSEQAIIAQSYQALIDENNQTMAYLEQVQDIKPMLKSYLAETAQALVGWSDVTSGPSIASDAFDL